jgi:hypothetical protein
MNALNSLSVFSYPYYNLIITACSRILDSVSSFDNGILTEETHYYLNGNIDNKLGGKNDKLHGRCEWYYEDG